MSKFNRKLMISMSLVAASAPALADNSAGFSAVYNALFGKETDRKELKTCSNTGGHSGSPLGEVNAFFCSMEKDFGITSAPTLNSSVSVTKSFGDRKVHVEMVGGSGTASQSGPGFADDGSSQPTLGYDYLAKVWVCKVTSSVPCTSATDFNLGLAIAFSYNKDGSVNKGFMLRDPGAVNASNPGATVFEYNLGSSASARKLLIDHIGSNGDKYEAQGSKSGAGVLTMAVVSVQSGVGNRMSSSIDTVANTVAASFDQSLALTDNTVTASAAQCFARQDDGAGDWKYSLSGSSCSVSGYAHSLSTVNAYTINGLLGVSGSNWTNGLNVSIHPSSI